MFTFEEKKFEVVLTSDQYDVREYIEDATRCIGTK